MLEELGELKEDGKPLEVGAVEQDEGCICDAGEDIIVEDNKLDARGVRIVRDVLVFGWVFVRVEDGRIRS